MTFVDPFPLNAICESEKLIVIEIINILFYRHFQVAFSWEESLKKKTVAGKSILRLCSGELGIF